MAPSSPAAEGPAAEDDYSAASPSDSGEAPTDSAASPPAPTPDSTSADGPSEAEAPSSSAVTTVKLSVAGTIITAVSFLSFL
ncbi:hypothetical protein Bca52824_005113 [Brassica carinata]|uniref:Uncharacterized protein n=1 Tax=Brassica carinata TaxID=52824 RepID=A0A8X7WN70_BRACI|nr:hypothetical protein Bca52824_005113 [Brassica carinata]